MIIFEFIVLGGDTFMNKDLHKIINYLASFDKVNTIAIYTNVRFIPKNQNFFLSISIKTMGGGLMQLVAYGAQDIYLTGNPQITFFKVVYRRHTNFSMESIQQTMNGTLGSGARLTATISRNGDLIHKMYCEMTTNGTGTAVDNRGAVALKEIELEICCQIIDYWSCY